jgi:4-amino-4-deoxy-L-arabinose transferase-like glycosyltransferase
MKAEEKKFLWVGGFAYFLLMLSFTFIFDFDGLYGQDSYSYLKQCVSIFSAQSEAGFWPPFYAFAGKVLSFGILPESFSLQIISILALILSGFFLLNLLQSFYPEKKNVALFVIVFFLLSPFVLRSGLLVMSDALAVLLVLATYAAYFLGENKKRIIGVFLFASLALLTRYALAPILAPILVLYCLELLRQKKISALLLGVLLFALPLLLNFFLWSTKAGSINHGWLQQWSLMNIFRSDFVTSDGIQNYSLPNLFQVLKVIYHPGFSIAFLLLLPFYRKEDFKQKHHKIILSAFGLYVLFLAGIPFQNDRFLLPLLPFWLVFSFPAFSRMMQWKLVFRSFFVPVCVVISFFLIHRSLSPMVKRNHLEREIASGMQSFQGQTLYAFDMDIALQGRGLNMTYINLWKHELDTFQSGALVLFNEEKFHAQWRGKNPMINYLRMKEGGQLIFVKNFSSGWQLSRLQ